MMSAFYKIIFLKIENGVCECVCVCVCVCIALVRKYQNFNSQIIKIYVDIYIWNYLFLHLCKFFHSLRYNFFSSFIKQNVCCWTGLILYFDLYSIAISNTKLLVEVHIFCVCLWTYQSFFFFFPFTLGLQNLSHFYNSCTIELLWLVSPLSCM